jgi:hypothetical protein
LNDLKEMRDDLNIENKIRESNFRACHWANVPCQVIFSFNEEDKRLFSCKGNNNILSFSRIISCKKYFCSF